ncbi:MAG: DUF1553 domain-containing protein [Bryobacteraceae bacterium]|nr:DUF1553 domain-containing protein [Bryobacteraceae bacterium]
MRGCKAQPWAKRRRRSLAPLLFLSIAFVAPALCPAQATPPKPGVDFQREIRPILSDACFQCHGPDKSTRMVGLRLDIRDGALEHRPHGAPIVPGNAAASLVYQRIASPNKARRMPPEHSHKTLTPDQVETIRRWIDEGAKWKEHWAFIAPERPKVPAVVGRAWVANPIDAFILSALEKKGLAPAPPANRRTLIRRVSLDLTGLPPSPEEVDAFVKDTRPDAYEKLVDRLLESPRWGEHRARYWLDAARYADTHGIHIDNYREMWPYRDWVIGAFNRNLPFDEFTVEQIAGDLLPERSMDQLIATGFHRANATTNEGGVIPEEIEAMYAKDRVDTTGAVFLGLTVGCATCHDHKFDPISQRDFYSMAAFFRNTTQDPLDGNIHDTPPVIVVPREEDLPRWKQIRDLQASLVRRQAEARESSRFEFDVWLNGEDRAKISSPLERADELLAFTVGDKRPRVQFRNQDFDFPGADQFTIDDGPLPGSKAVEFCGFDGVELPNADYFEADRPFSVAAWIRTPRKPDGSVIVGQTDPQSRGRGWMLEIGNGMPMLRLNLMPRRTATVRPVNSERLGPVEWHHVAVTYDGSRDPSGFAIYLDGRRVMTEARADRKPFPGDFRNYAPLRIAGDGRRSSFEGGAIADLRIYTRAITEDEALLVSRWPSIGPASKKPAGGLSAAERDALHHYFLLRQFDEYIDIAEQLRAIAEERKAIARRGAVTHVQQERPEAPYAHVLFRGMYDQPREKVEPAVPSALPPMPASFPRNRLGLARWLVDPANPLTARVTVNRFWQEVFGTGLVETAEDFGSQGLLPSHPELLDWLAVEFRESGWDVKKFFRLLVASSTYRQSSAATPLKLEKDPDNVLLSRGPRFRMDAEMVRDYALASSGLLSGKIGGPSVKPYQPDRIWDAVAMKESDTRFYQQDYGDNLYRRSLYTFWKRSAPPPSMDIFNAPTREACTVRRERTNTPLQALVTMNDPQFVEAARYLAAAALREAGPGADARFDYITRRVLGRALTLKERSIVAGAHRDFLAFYDSHPSEAAKLLSVGEAPPPGDDAPSEVAALTMVANQILNLDEALNK